MAFLNTPLKAISVTLTDSLGVGFMPWYNPADFPVQPGNPYPTPVQKDFRWRITLDVSIQQQSSYFTRQPGAYTGQDITVGQWIANVTSGQAWQIISIESKTNTRVIAIVQDVYRYNTFADQSGSGAGGPGAGIYIVFGLSDAGLPQIDPVPAAGISSNFTQNIQSRFEYINLQYDFPLYQDGNSFIMNDIIAADSNTNSFVLSDATHRFVIGRVTSISDTLPGWFTINPVQKIIDNLDSLPGNIGDIIYSSTIIPGGLTTDPGGSQVYIKLRNNSSSVSVSTEPGPTTAGNIFQLNGIDVTVLAPADATAVETAVNLESANTGVSASLGLQPSTVETTLSNLSSTYGEVVLWAASSPSVATINGVSVTFDILSTNPGYEDYTQAPQMAQAINDASIPNIIASNPTPSTLMITNSIGGTIIIVNITDDINGVSFAGPDSGSGLELFTSASLDYEIVFTAIDARAINFLDVIGNTVADFGLISVENGTKACGLYIEDGLRTASTVVVTNLAGLNALTPLIGDQAYVIDSDDGQGNNVDEWSLWLYDGVIWVETSNQDSATVDAKSLEYTLSITSPGLIDIGKISTGRRVTLITIEVTSPFDTSATLEIGYQINNPGPPVTNGLMSSNLIDLSVSGTYTTTTDILFGTDTSQGDVTVTATFDAGISLSGSAQIIVSYV
jgi:hypothetical protein